MLKKKRENYKRKKKESSLTFQIMKNSQFLSKNNKKIFVQKMFFY
jgi:hypothetical protein